MILYVIELNQNSCPVDLKTIYHAIDTWGYWFAAEPPTFVLDKCSGKFERRCDMHMSILELSITVQLLQEH